MLQNMTYKRYLGDRTGGIPHQNGGETSGPTGKDKHTSIGTDREMDTMVIHKTHYSGSTISKHVGEMISPTDPPSLLPKQSSGVTFSPYAKLPDTQQEIKLSIKFLLRNGESGNDIVLFFQAFYYGLICF